MAWEYITNGGFDHDDHWTKETGWTIGSNKASYVGLGYEEGKLYIKQTITSPAGLYYYSFDCVLVGTGYGILSRYADGTNTDIVAVETSGTYTGTTTLTGNTEIRFRIITSGEAGSVDNISIQRAVIFAPLITLTKTFNVPTSIITSTPSLLSISVPVTYEPFISHIMVPLLSISSPSLKAITQTVTALPSAISLSLVLNVIDDSGRISLSYIYLPLTLHPPSITGGSTGQYITFPDLSGNHLTLKFYNSSLTDGLELYYLRSVMLRSTERSEYIAKFPNLSGKHLTLKFYNSELTGESILYYMRSKIFKTKDRNDADAEHPNLSGKHLSLKFSQATVSDLTLEYISVGLVGKIE
jgi:hypothetical protein